jgi:dethiobiotin synthetase
VSFAGEASIGRPGRRRMVGGVFVTGTDTGVGKTVLSAALLAAIAAAGSRVRAHKPVLTGLDEPVGSWPRDHELLGAVAGMAAEEVAPVRYGPAASPHLAAELAGEALEYRGLLGRAREAIAEAQRSDAAIVVEGVGGLLAPLTGERNVRDLAGELGLPLLVASRPCLGTISHTLLTLEAARASGLEVAAVILTPWPARPSSIELSNRETIARLGRIEVHTLSTIPSWGAVELATAGERLPWRGWLERRAPYAGWRASGARAGAPAPAPARTAASTASLTAARSSSSIT